MSVRVLEREMGAVMTCNADCGVKMYTGQVAVGLIRHYAKTQGWIRGGAGDKVSPSRKRWDICPACAPAERARLAHNAKLKAERLEARDKARIERANLTTPKRVRKPRAAVAQEASAEP